MGHSEKDYSDQLRRLMPQGRAWTFHPEGVMLRLLRGLAGVLARVEARAHDVTDKEQFPSKTEELLSDWETELGLPDECGTAAETFEQRRYDVVAKYNETGGQSRAYFVALGRWLGLELTVDECKPFRVEENTVGQALQDNSWLFVWRIRYLPTRMAEFKVGQDTVNTPLRCWPINEMLECYFNKRKPAHTHLIVAYRDPDNPDPDDDYLLIR